MADIILDGLNPQQREAVVYNDGPQLVIAGAGSGKTRVLTYKIAYLLRQGCKPWNILALTFTNKAAREMERRIGALVGESTAHYLRMGTFHSIFSRILRIEAEVIGFNANYTIYDETDSHSLLKRIIKDMQLDDKVYKPASVHGLISMAKNCLITSADYAEDQSALARDRDMRMPLVYKIYEAYDERCRQANAMDFDDLLLLTYKLFNEHEDIRQKYADKFQHVLVDEYQDTNNVQQKIVWQLTKESQAVCAVGDDSQSIYSFRGANIDNILDFQNQYKGVKIFKLERNYRSTKLIVQAANSLIKHNERQIPKDVFSENGQGDKLVYKPTYSDKEEAAVVCNDIARMRRTEHYDYSDIAILYRTNAQSRPLEEQMRKQNIPYRIYGGTSFYQRKEIKDVLAYFRLASNPDDEEAFMRVINYPARGIGGTTVARLQMAARESGLSLWRVISSPEIAGVNRGTASKIRGFHDLVASFIQRAATEDVYQLGREIIEESGIRKNIYGSSNPDDVNRQENIDNFVGSLQDFVDIQQAEGNDQNVLLADYLPTVSLMTDADSDDKGDDNRVSMMTIHSAKGLEFKSVFIVGMEDNIIPSPMSAQTQRGLEEERRLLYVAITRAEDHCTLTSAQYRFRYGKLESEIPSRFLRDIDSSLIDVEDSMGSQPSSALMRGRSRYTSANTPWGSSRSASSSSWYSGEGRAPWSSAEARSHGSSANSYSHSDASDAPKPRRLTRLVPHSTPAGSQSVPLPDGLREGAIIGHKVFGTGTVISIEGSGLDTKVKVKFRSGEEKTLLLKYAKITVIS